MGVASCGWSLGWRHADRDQFGPCIRLRGDHASPRQQGLLAWVVAPWTDAFPARLLVLDRLRRLTVIGAGPPRPSWPWVDPAHLEIGSDDVLEVTEARLWGANLSQLRLEHPRSACSSQKDVKSI